MPCNDSERCHYCGLVNPGPEHNAYAPMLCVDSFVGTQSGGGQRAHEDRYPDPPLLDADALPGSGRSE